LRPKGPGEFWLIFDFDGTLAWLMVDWRSVRARIEALYGPLRGRPLFSWLQERVRRGLEVEEAFKLIKEAELSSLDELVFDEEIVELLRGLKARGAKMALVSMQDDEVLARALRLMGAEGLFDTVIGRRTAPLRASQLLNVLKRWGIRPEQAIFISDSPEDMRIGSEIGLNVRRLFFLDGSLKRWLEELLASLS